MPPSKRSRNEAAEARLRAESARKAAASADAGDREKADLRLLEQKEVAESLRAKRVDRGSRRTLSKETKLDQALQDTFPGSDPISFVVAAPSREGKVAPRRQADVRRSASDQKAASSRTKARDRQD
jgi:hypothetical protein